MQTKKNKSRILQEVNEMARDLEEIGLIDKRRMQEFDALCKLHVDEMPPQRIKCLREKERISQAVFASVLNTSLSTVQKWELGEIKPGGSSLKLLNLIERNGLDSVIR